MFEVTARLQVREGELEGFKEQAAEMMRQTREKDAGDTPLRLVPEQRRNGVRSWEGYVDADALLEHANNVGRSEGRLSGDFAYGHDMTIYGEPSPALAEAMEALAAVLPVQPVLVLPGAGRRCRGSSGGLRVRQLVSPNESERGEVAMTDVGTDVIAHR